MKSILKYKLILILTVFSFQVFADSNTSLMEVAANYYSEGNYNESIDTYNEILSTGYESSDLYYNLGNSYYKISELANAILYYEKAKLLAPNDEDISFNLELAQSHTVDKLDAIPEMFLISWYNQLSILLLTDTWAIISMISFALALLMLVAFIISSISIIKRLSFYGAMLILLVSIMSFIFSFNEASNLKNRDSAIIFSPSVTVKSSPDISGTDLFLLHEGTKVLILQEESDSYRIQLIDGNEGWVSTSSVKII